MGRHTTMADNHQKPTQAELEAQIAAAAADDVDPVIDEPADASTPDDATTTTDGTTVTDDPPAKTGGEPDDEAIVADTKDEVTDDYRKKFVESSREAQILHAKNKKYSDAVDAAAGLTDISDDEMRKEFPDWDDMTQTEQRLAKRTTLNERRFALISDARAEEKDVESWNSKVDEFIENPETLVHNPKLEGKQEEFRLFAGKPTRRGVAFDVLVGAFLHELAESKPAPKTGKMFETGTGGPNDRPKPKSDKIPLAEAQVIMETDYPRYRQLLKDNKIDFESV